ncbi:hypothetical protein CRG98_013785 [Punica granatum]|uniref:Uncharacterized protein n=1 Tax=Punica granatum TaxID=22663 RepID=A0A2I0KBC8_PUNGR|nr:hypothetical protein CRG98_013785 [Punica granatum]
MLDELGRAVTGQDPVEVDWAKLGWIGYWAERNRMGCVGWRAGCWWTGLGRPWTGPNCWTCTGWAHKWGCRAVCLFDPESTKPRLEEKMKIERKREVVWAAVLMSRGDFRLRGGSRRSAGRGSRDRGSSLPA